MKFLKERINETVKVLEKWKYSNPIPVEEIGYAKRSAQKDDISFILTQKDYETFTNGGTWSGKDEYALFRMDINIPAEYAGKPAMLLVTTGRENGWEALNPQFIVWTENGLKQGVDINHREILLDECAKIEKTYRVLLEGWSGLETMSSFLKIELMSINRDIEALYYDLLTARDIIFMHKQSEYDRIKMLEAVMPIVNAVYLYEVPSDEFYKSVSLAHEKMQKDFFEAFKGNEIIVNCTGHAHIDVAWQWEVRHSRKKVVRSFASAIDHMEQYPDFIFSSSQPQLYSFIKEDYPEFYEIIKNKMNENHFEAEGAMWLEADCNLISGESFVRQLVYGKKFMKEEFNADSKVLWLPDVFGYSAALPQLLKKSGIDYFATSKISWNECNRMPHDLFLWEGIDGSRVLTYLHTMPDPEDTDTDTFFATYSGQIVPSTISETWNRFKDKELTTSVLASYGFGDGGGGPTRRDLEYAKRLKNGMPGVPCVQTTKIADYFEELEKQISNKTDIPKWNGELYLELHRGTYTSIAAVKKYNRRCEIALHDLELAGAMAAVYAGAEDYPAQEIEQLWKTVLCNQFHDILPGSSIGAVYENSFREYEAVLSKIQELQTSMLKRAGIINCDTENMLVYNFLPFKRNDILIFDHACKSLWMPDGTGCPVQQTYDGRYLAWVWDIPSMGCITVKKSGKLIEPTDDFITVNESYMENKFFIIKFDAHYQIESIYDKREEREILSGKGNVLRAFEDRPKEYDAWEITNYYRDKEYIVDDVLSCHILECGPIRGGIEVTRKFLHSTIIQRIFIYSKLSRIDFDTEIDWHEKQILLKAGFPLTLQNDFATFDIAFGNIRRATHNNTSWDEAKFEVCAHKWADYSERGYGVALLNDCKYGYMAKNGMLEITLLKSASFPYAEADNGMHHFKYSLYLHKGDFAQGRVEHQAWMLNSGLLQMNAALADDSPDSLCSMQDDNVYIDTVKIAYDKNGIILRLHEYEGRHVKTTLTVCKSIKQAFVCDLLENNQETMEISGNKIPSLIMKPYEVKTIRLILESER